MIRGPLLRLGEKQNAAPIGCEKTGTTLGDFNTRPANEACKGRKPWTPGGPTKVKKSESWNSGVMSCIGNNVTSPDPRYLSFFIIFCQVSVFIDIGDKRMDELFSFWYRCGKILLTQIPHNPLHSSPVQTLGDPTKVEKVWD